jgi:hypothetical protein
MWNCPNYFMASSTTWPSTRNFVVFEIESDCLAQAGLEPETLLLPHLGFTAEHSSFMKRDF